MLRLRECFSWWFGSFRSSFIMRAEGRENASLSLSLSALTVWHLTLGLSNNSRIRSSHFITLQKRVRWCKWLIKSQNANFEVRKGWRAISSEAQTKIIIKNNYDDKQPKQSQQWKATSRHYCITPWRETETAFKMKTSTTFQATCSKRKTNLKNLMWWQSNCSSEPKFFLDALIAMSPWVVNVAKAFIW